MTTDDGLLTRMTVKLRQQICGLHGHDSLLHFDNGRMSLLCSSCGHESPGWHVNGVHASPAVPPGTRTHVVRMPYVDERRVAADERRVA